MGSELSTAIKPGLVINRHISGYVAGTAKIASIEIIRNGDILHTFHPDGNNFEYEYDDLSPFAQVTLKDPQNGAPFAFTTYESLKRMELWLGALLFG